MAKKKVKKYHQGGSHEDHHVQSEPAPPRNLVGPGGGPPNPDAKNTLSPITKKPVRPVTKKADRNIYPPDLFNPVRRTQPITVGGPKQVQPMPSLRPTVVGVTPQPMIQLPSRRLGNLMNDMQRRGGTATRVNPNAVLGLPRAKRRR